jgi:hypothetical protein
LTVTVLEKEKGQFQDMIPMETHKERNSPGRNWPGISAGKVVLDH